MEDQDENQDLREKKLRGSGGYVIAHVTDEEQKKGNLGGPELFLAGIGRLSTDRFVKYHCNKCDKDYQGSPNINFENPNVRLVRALLHSIENLMLLKSHNRNKNQNHCNLNYQVRLMYRRLKMLAKVSSQIQAKLVQH